MNVDTQIRNETAPDSIVSMFLFCGGRTGRGRRGTESLPRFAYLDACGSHDPGSRFAQRVELRSALWTMFFGPAFVEKLGREFLLAAPAWRVEDLGECGVMLTASQRYTDWLASPNEAMLAYLSAKASGLKPYRYKPIA